MKDDGRATWRTIRLRRDFGRALEIEDGIEAQTRIILGPPPDLREDQPVERDDGPVGHQPMRSAAR